MVLGFNERNFKDGTLSNLICDDGLGLENKSQEGLYLSKVYEVDNFKSLIASWESKTTANSSVELEIRVKKDNWSRWFTYGIWKDCGMNIGSISKQSDDIAFLSVDELICNEACNAFQFKVKFNSDDETFLKLNAVTISLKTKQTLKPYMISNTDIEVPELSQMVIPNIGHLICSPTSLTMVMNYYGLQAEVIDTAQGCFDNGSDIYGNWVYNVAYAGERGFMAFVRHCYDPGELVKYIQMGIPLVASIKTIKDDELTGAPQAYPHGHLVVIRGFSKKDQDYIIVNDPAAKTNETVKRYYLLSEFLKVWRNIIYVIRPNRM